MLSVIVATLGLVTLTSGQRCTAVCDPCTTWGGEAGWCFDHWSDGFSCSKRGGTKCDDPARFEAARFSRQEFDASRFYTQARQEFYNPSRFYEAEVSRQASLPTCQCPDFPYGAEKGDVMCQFESGCRYKTSWSPNCPGSAVTCTLHEPCPAICNAGNYQAGAKDNEVMCAYQNHCTHMKWVTRCEDNGKKCFLDRPAQLEDACIRCGFQDSVDERHACYNSCGGRSVETVAVPKYMVKLAGLALVVMFISCVGFSFFRYSKKKSTVENVSVRDSEYDSILM